MARKIGIFSGTFDPVHAGHIALALESLKAAKLDKVYFLPERSPRRKEGVTHYAHRVAMLNLALKPYDKFEVLELPDKQFSVSRTLPRLRRMLPDTRFYQIVGSDVLEMLSSSDAAGQWPGFARYLQEVTLLVGIRAGADPDKYTDSLKDIQPNGLIIKGYLPIVSSSAIRLAVGRDKIPKELLTSLRPYVKKHWLYQDLTRLSAARDEKRAS